MSIINQQANFLKRTTPIITKFYGLFSDPVKMTFDVFDPPEPVSDRAILVMHGLLGSKNNWKSTSRNLASQLQMQVFNLDARNHGDSPNVKEHSAKRIAEDIELFVEEQKLKKVYTIGHSMGGRAMMYFALKNPHIVERSIIVDISPISVPRDVDEFNNIFEAMRQVRMLRADAPLSEGRYMMRNKLLGVLGEQAASTVDFIMLNLRKDPNEGFYWAANIDALHRTMNDFDKFSKEITDFRPFPGEALFICGKRSKFFNKDEWPQVQKFFPNSRLEWVDAGHIVHIEKPKEFLELTTDFFSKNEAV